MPSRSGIAGAWSGSDRGAYRETLRGVAGAEAACVKVNGDNVSYSKSCFKAALKPVGTKLSSLWTD